MDKITGEIFFFSMESDKLKLYNALTNQLGERKEIYKMKGKKIVVFGTVAAMAVSAMGLTNVSAADGVTLSLYMNADDLAKPYIQKIISLYEKESGNKIDQQGLDRDSAENIALTKLQQVISRISMYISETAI